MSNPVKNVTINSASLNDNENSVRGANEKRNDQKSIDRDSNYLNLRINLLIIREMLKVICHKSKIGFKDKVCVHLGISDSQWSRFISQGTPPKKEVLANLLYHLRYAGIKNKFCRLDRPVSIKIQDLTEHIDTYFNVDSKKSDKDSAIMKIDKLLEEMWVNNDIVIANILTSCYSIINDIQPTSQSSLLVAHEALNKFNNMNFTEYDIQSEDFNKFIKNLAKTLERVETLADGKLHHNVTGTMQTITILLSFITKQDISKADANSQNCLDMMQKISETMLAIQETLLSDNSK